ncbi:MAG: 4-hydroxy-tetrahydrodipicolinate reductase [Fimbriimonas sp.]
MLKVAVIGASGRMGQEVVRALTPSEGFDLVAAVDVRGVGDKVRPDLDLVIEDNAHAALERTRPSVVVDFSHHLVVRSNALSALALGASPVIGATGLSADDVQAILEATTTTPAMIVPNFSIGAVLMMHFAELAARWIPDVEVIELHHDRKEDAPSGTAMLTCQRISSARTKAKTQLPTPLEKVPGARGGEAFGVPVHSVRLPGFLAHQEVIFGAPGEILTLRHDSTARSSFMDGVRLCCREVGNQTGLVVGMDSLLFG